MLRLGAIFFAFCTYAAGPALAEGEPAATAPQEVTISHVSGKPVPRFESLRYAAVNGRTGPSQDHPIEWHYQRVGLPVLVLKETRGWRYVRDPHGAEVWMHERTLTSSDTAMALTRDTLLSEPRSTGRPVAEVEDGAIVSLGRCERGYCHVSSGRHGGWAPMASLWGVASE
ncbi:MAG: SH3 domain-containing protein [Pseudomonadota bacterium]